MSTSVGTDPVLEARGISKAFGHVVALDGVDFEVGRGEVVALMGDNGAGKSTLVQVLAGALAPDAGELSLAGQPVHLTSPSHARELGVETIYQDLALAGDLDASANLFLGRETLRSGLLGRIGWLDDKGMRRDAERHVKELGASIPDVGVAVKQFSGGQRQSVAIARASVWARELILMDEPTAALGVVQKQHVIDLIRQTQRMGISVVVISHSVPEVMEVADRIVVLRLGRRVATLDPRRTSPDDVVAAITGATHFTPHDPPGSAAPAPGGHRDGR